jgi:acetoin utilization deacetylase AcuC-like enzyme
MVHLYYDPVFLSHDTGHHPEHPGRLTACWNRLTESSLIQACTLGNSRDADLESISAVHHPAVVERARLACERSAYLDADTPVSTRSLEAALRAAGAALQAVDDLIGDRDKAAFCLVRPPGHHATRSTSMGFCLLNNIAMAARHAVQCHGLDRVLIVDFDVHHGNGTQDIFYDDPSVFFFSSHRYPFYPGTGGAGETGSGAGLGTTMNLPIGSDWKAEQIVDRFQIGLDEAARRIQPQMVLLSAGFDAHYQDPIGGLRMDEEHFQQMTRMVLDVAAEHAQGKIISMLEGGYNTDVLARCVESHVRQLLEADGRQRV